MSLQDSLPATRGTGLLLTDLYQLNVGCSGKAANNFWSHQMTPQPARTGRWV